MSVKLASIDNLELTQCKTLAQTDDDTTSNEDTNVATGRERLHEGSDDDENGASGHADAATSIIGERSTHEETSHDRSNGVGSVDGTNGVGIGVVEVADPVLGALDGVED